MEPCFGVYWRNVRVFGNISALDIVSSVLHRGEGLRIPLLHHAKATELPFGMIIVTMMIGVKVYKDVPCNFISGFYSFQHMYRERKPCDPRITGIFVP